MPACPRAAWRPNVRVSACRVPRGGQMPACPREARCPRARERPDVRVLREGRGEEPNVRALPYGRGEEPNVRALREGRGEEPNVRVSACPRVRASARGQMSACCVMVAATSEMSACKRPEVRVLCDGRGDERNVRVREARSPRACGRTATGIAPNRQENAHGGVARDPRRARAAWGFLRKFGLAPPLLVRSTPTTTISAGGYRFPCHSSSPRVGPPLLLSSPSWGRRVADRTPSPPARSQAPHVRLRYPERRRTRRRRTRPCRLRPR